MRGWLEVGVAFSSQMGAGADFMLSFISGPRSGGRSSAVHRQDVEIVYEDGSDAAAMCCLLHTPPPKRHHIVKTV